MTIVRHGGASQLKTIITSQGSFSFAIKTFLERQDVVEQMEKANISIDLTDKGSIIANNLDVYNSRFTGRLIPPVVTKHNRLRSFPENSVFIGDGKDESTLKRLARSDVTFINYRKVPLRRL